MPIRDGGIFRTPDADEDADADVEIALTFHGPIFLKISIDFFDFFF
jgi:hypothetical protein